MRFHPCTLTYNDNNNNNNNNNDIYYKASSRQPILRHCTNKIQKTIYTKPETDNSSLNNSPDHDSTECGVMQRCV